MQSGTIEIPNLMIPLTKVNRQLFQPANLLIGDAGGHDCCSEESSTLATTASVDLVPVVTRQSLDVSPVANRTRSKARQMGLCSSVPVSMLCYSSI